MLLHGISGKTKPQQRHRLRRNHRLNGIAFIAEIVQVVLGRGFVDRFFCGRGAAAWGCRLLLLVV